MKIELIRTEEVDGCWFKIMVDNRNIECFAFSSNTESKRLEEASTKFDETIKRAKSPKSEILKSEIV